MVLSAQAGPESAGAPSCVVLSVRWPEWQRIGSQRLTGQLALYRGGETQPSGIARRCMANRPQPLPPTDMCRRSGRGCGRLANPARAAEGTVSQLPEQLAGQGNPQGGDRARIMPFGADAATLAGGSPAAAPGLIVQHGRRGWRGKNGSAQPSGTHTQRYIEWRDGETRASSGLHSVLIPTPV